MRSGYARGEGGCLLHRWLSSRRDSSDANVRSMDMSSLAEPPYYVLISHRQLSSEPSIPASSTLSHPTIEYHYADDAPHSLLPQFPGEHVVVLDYDHANNASANAKSLSSELAVTGLRMTEPPGAGVAQEPSNKNSKMYIIETTTASQER